MPDMPDKSDKSDESDGYPEVTPEVAPEVLRMFGIMSEGAPRKPYPPWGQVLL